MEDLWRQFKKTGDLDIRNDLLMHYIGQVKRVVSRLFPASRTYHDYDDLMSCGVLGLIDAIDKYDPERAVKFETYAQIRIRGAIIDYMRQQDWAPVHVRTRIKQVEQASDELAQNFGRPPSDQEIADYMDIALESLQNIFGESHLLNVLHLDELLTDAVTDDYQFKTDPSFDRELETKELKTILSDSISQLTEKEQLVLNLYYYDEMTLKEIGSVLALTESRISQIHSSVLVKLRSRLKKVLPYA